MWIIFAVVVNSTVLLIAILLLNRKINRKHSRSAVLDEVRGEVDEILTVLNQTTERNVGIIENRISRLSALVEDADRRLTLLRSETEKATKAQEFHADILNRDRSRSSDVTGSASPAYSGQKKTENTAPRKERPSKDSESRAVRRIGTEIERYRRVVDSTQGAEEKRRESATESLDDRRPGSNAGSGQRAASQETGRQDEPERRRSEDSVSRGKREVEDAPSPGAVRREVLDLYRKGFDSKIIAAKTGTALGEVELIISLGKGKV